MKIKNTLLVLTISLLLFVSNACNKDDDLAASSVDIKPTTAEQSKEEGEIILYAVNEGKLTLKTTYNVTGKDLEFQKDLKKHQQIWELIKKIVPANYRNKMKEFLIYKGEANDSSGFVNELKSDLSEWRMGIAIDFAFEGGFNTNGELAYTIIHEFGHILTLDNTQVDASISENNCANFYTGEGCAKNNSSINKLYELGWKDIWAEYTALGEDETKQNNFYTKHKSRFVTAYASTNPGEDIAEVFTTFVTKKEKPTGSTIADKKILLLYKNSDLVFLRSAIRRNTAAKGAKRSFKLPKAGSWKKATTIGKTSTSACQQVKF